MTAVSGEPFGIMRLAILLLTLLCAASGCMSLQTGGAAAAPAPPTSATAGATTIVAVAPPATPHPTLWQFLGADQIHADINAKCACLYTLLRPYLPVLDSPPPPPPIDDPANLESPNPAVKAAAEVKAEEDAAPAKAQALKYLAKVGCGCYPDVQEALIAGLDDCTEVVRFAAAEALYDAAGHPCQTCKSSSCCGPLVHEKLMQIAYEVQDNGCYFEPSGRVRRVARLALEACGGACPVPMEEPEEAPLPTRAPPAPAAEATAKALAEPLPTELVAELQGAAGSVVTRKGIMAASQLRGDFVPDVRLASTSDAAAGEDRGKVIATVNGESIYEAELDAAFQQRIAELKQELTLDAQRQMYRGELLWAVDVRLLLQAMEREQRHSGIAVAGHSAASSRVAAPADEAAARAWLVRTANARVQVAPEAVLDRYRRNISNYRTPASVRWEQVVIPFDRHTGREEADATIRLLRQRWLGGRLPPVDEAKLDQIQVQIVNWTEIARIEPEPLQQMLTRLAVGELSPIFEDSTGFRMVRVLERRSESTQPLKEVSDAIEAELRRELRQSAEQNYLTELRDQAAVWTIIPLAELPGNDPGRATASRTAPSKASTPPPASQRSQRVQGVGGHQLGARAIQADAAGTGPQRSRD